MSTIDSVNPSQKETLIRLWKGFWQIADPKIWLASTVPMAVALAMTVDVFSWTSLFWILFSMLGIYAIEVAKNASNEIMDYRSGVDLAVEPQDQTPFSGGKKVLVQRKLSEKELWIIAILFYGAGCGAGLLISFFWEFKVLYIGLAGVFLAFFYSVPPLKLAYRGWGEPAVGLTFGPLLMAGISLVVQHRIIADVLWASIPLGLLIANVLWINQYPDYQADRGGGKRNGVVRMGKEKANVIYGLLFLLAYLGIIALAWFFRSWFWLIPLASSPLALKAWKHCLGNYKESAKLIPANGMTLMTYLLTGLLMVFSTILTRMAD